jgi:SAM-dependent methyltransferase
MKNTSEHYNSDAYLSYFKDKLGGLSNCNRVEKIKKSFKYDQFHIGGVVATQKLVALMGGSRGGCVLDVGCGFGGVARYLTYSGGFKVFGLDLSASYVSVAQSIDKWLGFSDQISCERRDICDPQLGVHDFDWVVWSHLGMNIENKEFALINCANALKKSGKIIIYDVLLSGAVGGGGATYPLPWASVPYDNHAQDLKSYQNSLLKAGFKVIYTEKYDDILPEILENEVPLDVPPFAGADFRECLVNLRQFLAQDIGAPWFIIAEKM